MTAGRPLLLDIACGDGPAGEGYRRAGFDVYGVDIEPHDYRPGHFTQADGLDVLAEVARNGRWAGRTVDVIHMSWPCQRWSTATADPARHPDLITPARPLLAEWGGVYVFENVPRAPLIDPVRVCGSALGLKVRRHRAFESNADIVGTSCHHATQGTPVGVYGQHPDRRRYYRPDGTQRGTKATSDQEARDAMGVDWPIPWRELVEAIPPAYTEHIGRQIVERITR